MLKLQPELLLPKELEISYPPEVFEWVKTNLQGLRYITFKEVNGRNNYEPQCCKITVNSGAKPNELPEEKPNEICEKIYLVLQYYKEAADKKIKFCVTFYNKTNTGGDKPTAKHIEVGNDNTGEGESKFFDPNKVDGDLVDLQTRYIAQLQNEYVNMMSMVSNVIGQSIDSNKEKDKIIKELGQHQVEIKRMEYTAEAEKEEQKIRLILERERIHAGKEKLDNTLKQLNKNGALDRIMDIGSSKLFGMISGNEEIKLPPNKKKSNAKPSKENITEQQEKQRQQEQAMKDIEEGLKIAPLFTYCTLLKSSLDQEELENGNDSVNNYIRENLSESMLKDFTDLLNSEDEKDARSNLKNLHSNLSEEDFPKLMIMRSRMNDTQKKIITNILKFLEEESEE